MDSLKSCALDMLPLSERTRNALLKNGITDTLKLYEYCNQKFSIKLFKWIWRKWIKEIKESIKLMENDKELYWIKGFKNINTSQWPDFSESSLYIPIKKNKHNCAYSSHKKWILPIDEYLYKIYQWEKIFDKVDFLKIFIGCLSDDEVLIAKNRFLLLWKEKKLTFEELAIMTWTTGERVRQKEDIVLDKLNYVVNWLSWTQIWKWIVNEIALWVWDFSVVDYSKFENDFINWKLLSYFDSSIINDKYCKCILDSNEKFWNKVLVFNKFKYVENVVKKIFGNISKIYDKKRPEDLIIPLKSLVPSRLPLTIDIFQYEPIITLYLYHKFDIYKTDWWYLFKKNKKQLKYFVEKELNNLSEPIHYLELLKILREKYPEYEWTNNKVMHWLFEYWKNVWEWLYVKKNHSMEWWTVRFLAEKYLNDIWKPVTYETLKEYILKNKVISENSIKSLLFLRNENIFMKFNNWNIWLKKWGLPKWEKPLYAEDLILNFFKSHKWKLFSSQDIIDLKVIDISDNYVYQIISKLFNDWLLKKIDYWRFWKYYYGVLSWNEKLIDENFDNQFQVNISQDVLDSLKKELSSDIYTIKYFESLLSWYNIWLKQYEDLLLYLWYLMKTWYIIKKEYKNFKGYLSNKIKSDAIIRIDKDILDLNYNIVSSFCREFKLFKVKNDLYLSWVKMAENGIDLLYINNFFDTLKSSFWTTKFFSIKNVRDKISLEKFDQLWFNDDFVENIIFYWNWVYTLRLNNQKIFTYVVEKPTKYDFIESEMEKYSSIYLSEFVENVSKWYGLDLDYDIIKYYMSWVKSIYYNSTLDKLYRTKQDFYNEIYNDDWN